MKWIVLRIAVCMVLGSVNTWCIFNMCESRNRKKTKELELKMRELHLKEKELYLKEKELTQKDAEKQAQFVQDMLGGSTKKGVMM